MRYLALTLLVLMCPWGLFAQSNKVKQSSVNKLSESVRINAIDPLDNEIQSLQNQITSIKSQIDRVKNRNHTKKPAGGNIQDLLSDYTSLHEIYLNRADLLDRFESDGSEMAQTYSLAIRMMESLEKVYNKTTNAQLINSASLHKAVLPKHRQAFEELVTMVTDYNFYMYELARLFVAADEDNYKSSAKDLTDRENAPHLMNVPYTNRVLTKYITGGGILPQIYIVELKNAKPETFSGLKEHETDSQSQ